MKVAAVGQLVSRSMWRLMIVLAGYGSNDNRLKVWGSVEWIVCHSDDKHPHQMLLAIV